MRASLVTVGWMIVAAAAGCGPDDGVLSLAFGLSPPAAVSLPTEAELGAALDAAVLARASGKFVATPPSGSGALDVAGLPPLPAPATYRFVLRLGHHAVPPQTASLAAAEEEEVVAGELRPDELGRAKLSVHELQGAERIEGGRVEIVVPAGASSLVFRILEGSVGNLADAGEAAPAPATGGHTH